MSEPERWNASRIHWGTWDLIDERGRVIAQFDDAGGSIELMEEKATLAAAAPLMKEALEAEEAAQAAWENCAGSGRAMDDYTRALCEHVDELRRAALAACEPPRATGSATTHEEN